MTFLFMFSLITAAEVPDKSPLPYSLHKTQTQLFRQAGKEALKSKKILVKIMKDPKIKKSDQIKIKEIIKQFQELETLTTK